MVKIAFKDVDGDLLHISYVKDPYPYTDGDSKYHNTYSFEIEMVTSACSPAVYFNADQLRTLIKVLIMAAEHLESKGE